MGLSFHFDRESHNLHNENDDNVIHRGDEIMTSRIDRSEPNTGTFNDVSFYLGLRRRPGCVRVNLEQVFVRRNSYILGIKAEYRCTWNGGITTRETGPFHNFENGPYANEDAGEPIVQTLVLDPGEFIRDVVTRQGDILDALWFVTNRRTEFIGGFGGFDLPDRVTLSDTSNRHIVAFAGTYRGVIHRIGYYSNSEIRTALVMLRSLCEQRRAAPKQTGSPFDWIIQNSFAYLRPRLGYTPFDWIMRKLFASVRPRLGCEWTILKLVAYQLPDGDVPDDIFRKILEYL